MGKSKQKQIKQVKDTNQDLLDDFDNKTTKSEFSEILGELFNKEKIDMITDLSKDEIKLITRMYGIAELKKVTVWNTVLKKYMLLRLSKDRLSRREIIDAVGNIIKRRSLLSRMNPFNNRSSDF